MEEIETKNRSSKKQRKDFYLVIICLTGLLLSLVPLVSEDIYSHFFGSLKISSESESILLINTPTLQKRLPTEVTQQIGSQNVADTIYYIQTLYDLYDVRFNKLIPRRSPREWVKLPVRVSWNQTQAKMFGQVSHKNDFSLIGGSFIASENANQAEFKSCYIGTNYYRLSQDSKSWSEAKSFQVQSQSLNLPAPELVMAASLSNFGGINYIAITPKGDPDLTNFIIEISKDEKFLTDKSTGKLQIIWAESKAIYLPMNDVEGSFIRMRGLNKNLEMTAPTLVSKIEIEKPKVLESPRLTEVHKPRAKTVEVPEKRKPTSTVATSTYEYVPEVPSFLNRSYPDSKLSFEGSGLSMFSQDQVSQGKTNPTALMLGLRNMNWFGAHGIESSFKAKLVTVSSSAGGDVSPMQIEARYRYRFPLPISPFSKLGSSQMSVLAGYEYYRNPGTSLFSPKYDLMKLGMTFDFPMFSRWDTGGELVYGYGTDKSTKYEISGHLSYYVEQKWSLGLGYRAHFFTAGSDASSPLGVPYREALGEAYSVLRWHY